MTGYTLTPYKNGMRWRTPYNKVDTIEDVKNAVDWLLNKGYSAITIRKE